MLLTLIKGSDRIDRTAFITALGQLIPVTDIDSSENLGNFSERYVVFKSINTRQNIFKNDELKMVDQVFMISEPYKHVKMLYYSMYFYQCLMKIFALLLPIGIV